MKYPNYKLGCDTTCHHRLQGQSWEWEEGQGRVPTEEEWEGCRELISKGRNMHYKFKKHKKSFWTENTTEAGLTGLFPCTWPCEHPSPAAAPARAPFSSRLSGSFDSIEIARQHFMSSLPYLTRYLLMTFVRGILNLFSQPMHPSAILRYPFWEIYLVVRFQSDCRSQPNSLKE